MLPPFLRSTLSAPLQESRPSIAEYVHSERLGKTVAHCLWWQSKDTSINPTTVLLFVPGNPGLADFYVPYLSYVHQYSLDTLAILAHSLLGHSPHVSAPPLHSSSLNAQVEAIIETIDDIDLSFGPDTKIVLVAHSVGSWITLQTLRERSSRVTAAFLLFPTIRNILRTPNGGRLSWLFNGHIPQVLALMANIFKILPRTTLRLLFRNWPEEQIDVLWQFLNSPPAILACLTMARQEMETIKDLDLNLFSEVKHKLYFFLAEKDDWVGTNKEAIMQEMRDEPHSVRVIHGQHGIPHAYCINHGRELGEQTLKWLKDDIFSLPARAEVFHHR